jgi:hypothetical protein
MRARRAKPTHGTETAGTWRGAASATRGPRGGARADPARARPLAPTTADEVRTIRATLAERLGGELRSLDQRVEAVGEAVRRWRDPQDAGRRAILKSLVEEAGFAPATAAAGLDAALVAWSPRAWRELARRELGGEQEGAAPRQAVVPHLLGSALPGPGLLPLLLTLVAGGAPLARAGRHAPSLPAAALASLAAVDPVLAARGAACVWPRSRTDLTRALFEGARVATATGGEAAIRALRTLIGPGTRLLEHPHRASFVWVGASAAAPAAGAATARRIARDVALHDQLGCLSPVGVLVEDAQAPELTRFAAELAAALAERQRTWPRSMPPPEAALAVRSFHDHFALSGAAAQGRLYAGEDLAWIVAVLGAERPPPTSPLYRCVWLRAARDASDASRLLMAWRGVTAAVGFRGTASERRLAAALARDLGASRLCAAGRMQSPPLAWPQDGASPLRDLLLHEAA